MRLCLDQLQKHWPHKGRGEGDNHFPLTASLPSSDVAQDMVGLLGCRYTLLAHVELFMHQNSQVLICRAALHEFFSQTVKNIWDCCDKSAASCTWNGIPSLYCINCWKTTSLKTDPWRTPLITGLHLDMESLTATLCLQPSIQLFIHWIVHLSNLYLCLMWGHIKGLAKLQVFPC